MFIRTVERDDRDSWRRMRDALWPAEDHAREIAAERHLKEAVASLVPSIVTTCEKPVASRTTYVPGGSPRRRSGRGGDTIAGQPIKGNVRSKGNPFPAAIASVEAFLLSTVSATERAENRTVEGAGSESEGILSDPAKAQPSTAENAAPWQD
jgi:hypothetical protein